MRIDKLIHIEYFCELHQIQVSFLEELESFELIHTVIEEDKKCLPAKEIPVVEKMIRLHNELEINPAGIDAIFHLLGKLDRKQEEIIELKQKLKLFID